MQKRSCRAIRLFAVITFLPALLLFVIAVVYFDFFEPLQGHVSGPLAMIGFTLIYIGVPLLLEYSARDSSGDTSDSERMV
jgi:hypothetical protein